MIHVAILQPRYLQAIIDGRKTIEIRLTRTNREPFECVEAGERIYFKRSGGAFLATGVADHVLCTANLSARDIDRLRRDYDEWIGADAEFWRSRRDSRYATLIWLRDIEPILLGPKMKPHHGVAWQCLPDSADVYPCCRAAQPDTARRPKPILITLTAGNIRNGHVYLKKTLDCFPPDALGGATRRQAGRAITLRFLPGPTVRTDIVGDRGIFRTRVWRQWFIDQEARPGDRVRIVPQGRRAYSISLETATDSKQCGRSV